VEAERWQKVMYSAKELSFLEEIDQEPFFMGRNAD